MIGAPFFQTLVSQAAAPVSETGLIAHVTTSGVDMYEYASDTISFMATVPGSSPSYSAAFSPSGNYLAAITASGARHQIWSRSGTSFTLLSAGGSSLSSYRKPVWINDGLCLVGTNANGSSSVRRISISGSSSTTGTVTWTAGTPTSSGFFLCANQDGYVFIGGTTGVPSTSFAWGKVTGTSIELLSNPATLHTGAIASACWSNDGNMLIVCSSGAGASITVFERSGDTLTYVGALSPTISGANTCIFNEVGDLLLGVPGTTDATWAFSSTGTSFSSLGSWGVTTGDSDNVLTVGALFSDLYLLCTSRFINGSGGVGASGSLHLARNTASTITPVTAINTVRPTQGASLYFGAMSAIAI